MARIRFSIVASCVVLVALPAFAQTFAPGGSNVVRDSTGQIVGQYDAANNQKGTVSTVINGLPVYLDADRDRLTIRNEAVFYDQPNCQGTTYLEDDAYGVTTPAAFTANGTVLISPTRPATSRVIASYYDDTSGQCTNNTLTIPADPTQAGPNMKTRFTAPFTIGPGVLPTAIVQVPTNGWLLLGAIFAAVTIIALLRLRS
jgi:hypothetical protein